MPLTRSIRSVTRPGRKPAWQSHWEWRKEWQLAALVNPTAATACFTALCSRAGSMCWRLEDNCRGVPRHTASVPIANRLPALPDAGASRPEVLARAGVPSSGVTSPEPPPRRSRGGPRTSTAQPSCWACKGWAGPFPWFENHLNQTNHVESPRGTSPRGAHRTVRDTLASYGSHHPHATSLARRQCANKSR
jgi:hypothetical protein